MKQNYKDFIAELPFRVIFYLNFFISLGWLLNWGIFGIKIREIPVAQVSWFPWVMGFTFGALLFAIIPYSPISDLVKVSYFVYNRRVK